MIGISRYSAYGQLNRGESDELVKGYVRGRGTTNTGFWLEGVKKSDRGNEDPRRIIWGGWGGVIQAIWLAGVDWMYQAQIKTHFGLS